MHDLLMGRKLWLIHNRQKISNGLFVFPYEMSILIRLLQIEMVQPPPGSTMSKLRNARVLRVCEPQTNLCMLPHWKDPIQCQKLTHLTGWIHFYLSVLS